MIHMLVIVHDLQSPSSVPTTPPTKKLKSSHLCTLSPNSPGQLNVLGHDGNPLCMDSTQVGILKQANQVCFTGFLQSKQTKVNPSRRIQSHRSNSCICFYKCGGGTHLQSTNRCTLETQVCLEILSDFPDKTLKRQLPDEQLGGLLIPTDLTQGNGTRPTNTKKTQHMSVL